MFKSKRVFVLVHGVFVLVQGVFGLVHGVFVLGQEVFVLVHVVFSFSPFQSKGYWARFRHRTFYEPNLIH